MPATTFTAVAPLAQKALGEHDEPVFKVEMDAFDGGMTTELSSMVSGLTDTIVF